MINGEGYLWWLKQESLSDPTALRFQENVTVPSIDFAFLWKQITQEKQQQITATKKSPNITWRTLSPFVIAHIYVS